MFQVPSIITKIITMSDRGLRLYVDTQELNAEEKAKVFALHEHIGWFIFKESVIEPEDIDLPDLPKPILEDGQKSKSQIQRSVLYVFWEKRGKKDLYNRESDFDTFYNQYMDSHINKIKMKIEELKK